MTLIAEKLNNFFKNTAASLNNQENQNQYVVAGVDNISNPVEKAIKFFLSFILAFYSLALS